MNEVTKKQLRELFAKDEKNQTEEAEKSKKRWEASESFYQKFADTAKHVIKPDLQQVAEMFLEKNFPAAVYEGEHEIAIQIDRKGNKLDAVNRKDFPGVRLAFWANSSDGGFVLLRPGGLIDQNRMRETKVNLSDLTSAKILELLKTFVPQALEELRR